jgi:hypothetical protein
MKRKRLFLFIPSISPLIYVVSFGKEGAHMADDDRDRKCKHPSCSCRVSGDDNYCSEYCRDAGDITEIGCGCEHPACR